MWWVCTIQVKLCYMQMCFVIISCILPYFAILKLNFASEHSIHFLTICSFGDNVYPFCNYRKWDTRHLTVKCPWNILREKLSLSECRKLMGGWILRYSHSMLLLSPFVWNFLRGIFSPLKLCCDVTFRVIQPNYLLVYWTFVSPHIWTYLVSCLPWNPNLRHSVLVSTNVICS